MGSGYPNLRVTLTLTLRCACYSSDAKHLAIGLLDATVKVLFVDTFKQYLTLFGHKLPVLAVSISSDGSLLASASADKTVKIWGP